jgi:eukaryotic-like serine/threonine-protein kinase
MNQDLSEQDTQNHNALSSALAETLASVEVKCPICNNLHCGEALDPDGHEQLGLCGYCRENYLKGPSLPEGYSLTRELGRGGMGAVYLANIQGEERAIKVLLPTLATSAERRALFLKEASIHQQLTHPKIVTLYELCQLVPGVFCMVMEYVPGVNAASLLQQGPLAIAAAINIVEQALEGLAYIHEQGFLHRDIKDPNFLVVASTQQGPPPTNGLKIADFGLAVPYALLGKNLSRGEDATANTSGTLPYMAPEAFTKHQPSPQMDLYAMGATLYRLLTNEYPHDLPAGKAKVPIIALRAPVPITERRADLPRGLVSCVHRALARDPAERFQSASEMRRALLEV